jgi:hypothetical protein
MQNFALATDGQRLSKQEAIPKWEPPEHLDDTPEDCLFDQDPEA